MLRESCCCHFFCYLECCGVQLEKRLVSRTLLADLRAFEFVSVLISLLFDDSSAFSKKTTCLPCYLNPLGFVEG